MTTSLIDMLRDCLPFHAAWCSAEADYGVPGKIPPASALQRYVQVQAPGSAAAIPAPPVPKTGFSTYKWSEIVTQAWSLREAELTAPLWGLKLQPPNMVTEVNCRAREDGYRLHGVLTRLTFGLNGEPKVKVVVKATGQELELPLDAAHLYTQLVVKGGWVPKGRRTMWPLEALHDGGFVMVFIYEPSVDGAGQITLPLSPFQPSGAGNWEPVRALEKSRFAPLAPPGDPDGWLEAMTGPFLNVGAEEQVSAKTTETKERQLLRPRIVVVVSVACCRERDDFEPGGLVGMAKLIPNIMLASAVELASLEATVKVERTASTTVLDDGNGSAKGTCCGAYQQCGALLVADANSGSMSQKPFWGGTFAYVETAANERLGGQRLHVVDRSKGDRTGDDKKFPGGKRLLVSREPALSKEYAKSLVGLGSLEVTGVEKVPGQGEFDNLHLAPQLKLDLASINVPTIAVLPDLVYKVDPAECATERVWMAPFCSHDCFHTHWRWGAGEEAEWTTGWNETGPHKKSGAPMIPVYQDAWLELHGPSSYSYHAKSTYDEKFVRGTWDIVMHHGCAYAQAISNFAKFLGSQLNLFLTNSSECVDSKGRRLALSHPPLMYWLLRYQVQKETTGLRGGKVSIVDRIQFTQAQIDGARKF